MMQGVCLMLRLHDRLTCRRGEPFEHAPSPSPSEDPPARVFLVDGLTGHVELVGDGLPGPPELAGPCHLESFELLQEPPQGRHRLQSDLRIPASRLSGQLRRIRHPVNLH